MEWSGKQKEIKQVAVLFEDAAGATQPSAKSLTCGQRYIIVDEATILPCEDWRR